MKKKLTAEQETQKRVLILCVDRDADIEIKAGIKTPILGRTANLDAAVSLALKDPEEADANTMFEAVRLNDRLQTDKKPEETFEVATISGSELGGVSADRKLVDELNTVTDSFDATEVILVTDGFTDEAVLPLVQSRVPVSSIRRIVIKHSESIEETAAIFSKYFRMLVDDPRYSRIALGIPGLLFFLFGVLYLLIPDFTLTYYLITIVIVLGGFMLVKGFGVDKSVRDLYKWAREYTPPPIPVQIANYVSIAGILCMAVSIYLGATSVNAFINSADFLTAAPQDLAGWLAAAPAISGYFIKGTIDLLVVGIGTVLFGRSLLLYFERDPRILRNAALIVSVTWTRWILAATGDILITPDLGYGTLVFNIIVGVLIGIASVLIIIIIHRSAKGFFKESNEEIDDFGEPIESSSAPTACE
jgi:putative membrane protein